jgi:hypothetical protein
MRPEEQRGALDRFAGVADAASSATASAATSGWCARRDLADRTRAQPASMAQEADRLTFALAEIDAVDPQPGEDERAGRRDRAGCRTRCSVREAASRCAHRAVPAHDGEALDGRIRSCHRRSRPRRGALGCHRPIPARRPRPGNSPRRSPFANDTARELARLPGGAADRRQHAGKRTPAAVSCAG